MQVKEFEAVIWNLHDIAAYVCVSVNFLYTIPLSYGRTSGHLAELEIFVIIKQRFTPWSQGLRASFKGPCTTEAGARTSDLLTSDTEKMPTGHTNV